MPNWKSILKKKGCHGKHMALAPSKAAIRRYVYEGMDPSAEVIVWAELATQVLAKKHQSHASVMSFLKAYLSVCEGESSRKTSRRRSRRKSRRRSSRRSRKKSRRKSRRRSSRRSRRKSRRKSRRRSKSKKKKLTGWDKRMAPTQPPIYVWGR